MVKKKDTTDGPSAKVMLARALKENAPKLCTICKKNPRRYIWKTKRNICRNCWDRLEFPHLKDKTDDELDAMYAMPIKNVRNTRQ